MTITATPHLGHHDKTFFTICRIIKDSSQKFEYFTQFLQALSQIKQGIFDMIILNDEERECETAI